MSGPSMKDAFFKYGASAKKIGGQAIIEGVMMRGEKSCAMAVRRINGTVEVIDIPVKTEGWREKYDKTPVVRGVLAFVSSLILGMKTLMRSAEIASYDLPEAAPTKFEAFLLEKFGEKRLMNVAIYVSVTIAIMISVGLFMAVPVVVGNLFKPLITKNDVTNKWALSLIEGIVRILIFLTYIFLISMYKDIQRVFEFHGAEHKVINCYEADAELNIDNAKGYPRLHKRCGTSFLFIVMIISLIIFMFISPESIYERITYRILLVPIIAGASYEFLKFAGKSNSKVIYALSCPGLLLQRATTKEPDDSQLEAAIAALQRVIEADAAEDTEEDTPPAEDTPAEEKKTDDTD